MTSVRNVPHILLPISFQGTVLNSAVLGSLGGPDGKPPAQGSSLSSVPIASGLVPCSPGLSAECRQSPGAVRKLARIGHYTIHVRTCVRTYMHTPNQMRNYICMYIYIYIERERERHVYYMYMYAHVYFPTCLPIYLCIYLSIYLPIYPSDRQF